MAKIGAALAILILAFRPGSGDELRIDRKSQWQTWRIPVGAIELLDDGGIQLSWFSKGSNPLEDMGNFEHSTRKQGVLSGGAQVFSNEADVRFLHDGDHGTWWQPDPEDGLDNWWLHVDLGRVVLLEKIRLVFPDTVGARPFEDFSVYVSEGSTVSSTEDVYRFRRVGITTRPNRERVREFTLFTIDPPGGGSHTTGENLILSDTLDFRPVQYVRFVPHKLTSEAALAELELVAAGENIGLGTIARGGRMRAGMSEDKVYDLFDGTVDKAWNPASSRAAEAFWQDGGQWFEWDLGVAFWLDRIVLYSWPPTEMGRSTYYTTSSALGHELSVSDGAPIAFAGAGEIARIRSNFDYTRLSLMYNVQQPRRWIFDHRFERQKVRYIFWHHEYATSSFGFLLFESFLYGEGYPAEVVMESDFIDLRSAKEVTGLSWEAELPPGASIQIQTKTGEELTTKTLYYDRKGNPVSEEKYFSLKKVARGETEEIIVEGDDWSSWSEPYKIPGEDFRSPSPRRYMRVRQILFTADPAVTPVLRSLSVFYNDALIQAGITAQVFPREARVGERQAFSLHLRPTFTARDLGFDGLTIPVPADVEDVSLAIGGVEESDFTYEMADDTLRLSLPNRVLRDSVVVRFTGRPLTNPTQFNAFVTNSAQPDSRQGVKGTDRDALKVYLPDVALRDRIISNLAFDSESFTPNEDGINDQLRLSFDLLKVDAVPQIVIHDLAGRRIRALPGQPGKSQAYLWDGRTEGGDLATPGLYIILVKVDVGVGAEKVTRLVSVVY